MQLEIELLLGLKFVLACTIFKQSLSQKLSSRLCKPSTIPNENIYMVDNALRIDNSEP